MESKYRGSRKHILDWVDCPDFTRQLSEMLKPTGAIVRSTDLWMPQGYNDPEEARLERFGPRILPMVNWQLLKDWWLVYKPGANTPNWDLVSTCTIQGRRGLILIEAKAHSQELKTVGKHLAPNASYNSKQNHERIGLAINEAGEALRRIVGGVNISRDTHYQLANRIAFSWKIATLGLPIVLVYLGFLGDKNISDVGEPIRDDNHWELLMRKYMSNQIPEDFVGRWIDCERGSMRMILRSMLI